MIVRAKLIGLLISSYDNLSRVLRKKPPSEPKISRFYIICSHPWPKYLAFISFLPFSRSWYTEQQWLFSCIHSEIYSEASYMKKVLTLPLFEPYDWDYPSSIITMRRPWNYDLRTYRKAGKIWRAYSIIKVYYMFRKLSNPNWLVVIMMTRWLVILKLRKLKNW